VKLWFTFNEPWVFVVLGYGTGLMAPGRKEPANKLYLAAHHVLLAHAEIVQTVRGTCLLRVCVKAADMLSFVWKQYRATQDGKIGMALNSHWAEPKTDSEDDLCVSPGCAIPATVAVRLFSLDFLCDAGLLPPAAWCGTCAGLRIRSFLATTLR
jgi:hypothetical protein